MTLKQQADLEAEVHRALHPLFGSSSLERDEASSFSNELSAAAHSLEDRGSLPQKHSEPQTLSGTDIRRLTRNGPF